MCFVYTSALGAERGGAESDHSKFVMNIIQYVDCLQLHPHLYIHFRTHIVYTRLNKCAYVLNWESLKCTINCSDGTKYWLPSYATSIDKLKHIHF